MINLLEENNEMLTPDEVAKIYRISVDSVTRLLRQGKIPGDKIGGTWRVSRVKLRKHMDEQEARRKNTHKEGE